MTQENRRDSAVDRRRKPTPGLSRYFLCGRRRTIRRQSDALSGYYVDRPSPAAVLSAMILIGLSLLDALLSLRLFSLGTYYEFNPLLALVLDRGTGTFLLVKAAATVSAALVLVVHWNFVFAGRVSLPTLTRVLVRLYVSIVAYEIVLLTQG